MCDPHFPNLNDWADARSDEIAAGMFSLPVNETISAQIGQLMERACNGGLHTLATMAEYVSVAHGLHQASAMARATGDAKWAKEMFDLGQVFLHYAVSDMAAIAAMTRASLPNQSGLNAVH